MAKPRDLFETRLDVALTLRYNILMKAEIHPTYYPQAKIRCACGASYIVGATMPELQVEVCASCHPFYTGKDTLVDVAGRVDRFRAKVVASETLTRGGKKARQDKERMRREKRAQRIERG